MTSPRAPLLVPLVLLLLQPWARARNSEKTESAGPFLPEATGRSTFNFAGGNAVLDVLLPAAIPFFFSDVSEFGGDATLVIRYTTLSSHAWYEATAPYRPHAVGVYSRLLTENRRPASDTRDNTNLNIAIMYSSLQVFNSFLPNRKQEW